jgi:nicotinamide-nucleotide amidase
MKAIIITIGDELLIGQVVNTNASFIAGELNGVGIEVARMLTVPDRYDDIVRSFGEAFSGHDVIIVTGGLGPTHDDITRKAVCGFFGTDLVPNAEARSNVERFLARRRQPWSEAAENQTLIPRNARPIPNSSGTAPGELIEKEGKVFIVMPGVPGEMEGMMRQFVVPFFSAKGPSQHILHKTLKTTGIAESLLAGKLEGIERILGADTLAYLPSPTGVRLRISVIRPSRELCELRAKELESFIRERAGKFIYATGEEELEETLGRLLTERRLTIAVAESCTGGMIAHRITNVSGSSNYFERGVVAYSNESKIALLGVSPSVIDKHGAVSEETAIAMARGVRESARTSIGVSTTGIAGPTGGSADKPVGLVWIGYADAEGALAVRFFLGEERLRIKERAAQAAMELVRRKILRVE